MNKTPKDPFTALPKRVQRVIETCRSGETLCAQSQGQGHVWFFEPSGWATTDKAASRAVATPFLQPSMDGLFPNMSQTWRAAP